MRMFKKTCIILILPPQKTSKTYIDCINLLKVRIISCYHCFFFAGASQSSQRACPNNQPSTFSLGKNYKGCMMLKYCTWSISCQKKLVWGMSPDFFFLPGLPEVLPYTSPMLCMSLDWLKENLHRKRGKWTQKSMAACVTGQRTLKWLLWSIMIYYVSLHYKDKSVSSLRLCQ